MNIFFLGGTFDPPHIGHYKIVEDCLKLTDKLILLPNRKSLDSKEIIASYKHRSNMLKILFDNLDVEIDDYEYNSGKTNYTIHTINYLKNKYAGSSLTMVLGADQMNNIYNWYNYKEIIKKVDILCFNRPGEDKKNVDLNVKINFVEDFNLNVSSTLIKKQISCGIDKKELENLLYPNVIDYIFDNKIYVN